jgi:hypothetical protein
MWSLGNARVHADAVLGCDLQGQRRSGSAGTWILALLKIDGDKPFPAVKWGDSDKVRVGDQVFAVGNP